MKSYHNRRRNSLSKPVQTTSTEDASFSPPIDRTENRLEASCTQPSDRILIRAIRRELDRLRISVLPSFYGKIKSRLKEQFGNPKRINQKATRILRFHYLDTVIDLIYPKNKKVMWPKQYCRFHIQITGGPADEVQRILINFVLFDFIGRTTNAGNPFISVSQIEFALDLIPEKIFDIELLHKIVCEGLFLPKTTGRSAKFYGDFEETLYLGLHGNKRLGSKGITVYQYPRKKWPKECVRVELQLNRSFIKNQLPAYSNLQCIIPFDLKNPLDYMEYRHFLEMSFYDFFNSVRKSPSSLDPRFKYVAARVKLAASEQFHHAPKIIDKKGRQIDNLRPALPATANAVKKICKKHGRKWQDFFPTSPKDVMIKDDIMAGFVRLNYDFTVNKPTKKESQSLAAINTNRNQKEKTIKLISQTIQQMKETGQKVTQESVAKSAEVSRRTVANYWNTPQVKDLRKN